MLLTIIIVIACAQAVRGGVNSNPSSTSSANDPECTFVGCACVLLEKIFLMIDCANIMLTEFPLRFDLLQNHDDDDDYSDTNRL